jgi:hypothetical protein
MGSRRQSGRQQANACRCAPGWVVNVSRDGGNRPAARGLFPVVQSRSIGHMAPQRIEDLDNARRLQLLVEGVVDYALYSSVSTGWW